MHLAMVITVSCWAANMVAVKEALFGFSPMALTVVRAIAVAVTFGILFLLLTDRALLRLTRRQLLHFVVIAFFGVTVNQMLFIYGVAYTNIPHAALIIAVEPVMVLVLSVVMRLEVLTALKFAGMAISLTGVVLLTYGKPAQGSQAYWLGDLIMLVEVVVFAYYTILMKEVINQYDVVTLNTVVFGLGFMTSFSCVIGYLLFAYALKGLTASRVAAFNYIEPVMATALGIWLLHDKVGLWGIFGGALILLGVYFTEWERDEEQAT